MREKGDSAVQPRRSRSWIRRLLIALATIFLLLVVFHGPILRPVVHSLAIHLAAKENLKLDFQIEGGILGEIELRNVHAAATGPAAVQSFDADLIRANYSLTNLILHGTVGFSEGRRGAECDRGARSGEGSRAPPDNAVPA